MSLKHDLGSNMVPSIAGVLFMRRADASTCDNRLITIWSGILKCSAGSLQPGHIEIRGQKYDRQTGGRDNREYGGDSCPWSDV